MCTLHHLSSSPYCPTGNVDSSIPHKVFDLRDYFHEGAGGDLFYEKAASLAPTSPHRFFRCVTSQSV